MPNARGNICVHGTCYREVHVYRLSEEFVRLVQLICLERLISLNHRVLNVSLLSVQLLDDCKHFSDVLSLEREVLVLTKDVFLADWGNRCLGRFLLLVGLRLGS